MTMKDMHSWSVIIPTLTEADTIQGLLEDICKQTYLPIEVIIVDAGSEDGTKAVVQKFVEDRKKIPGRELSEQPNIRFFTARPPVGFQRSFGGDKATGEYLCFLDADVRLDPDFLEKSLQAMHRRGLHTACPQYIPIKQGSLQPSMFAIRTVYAIFNLLFKIGEQKYPSGAGSCILTRKDVFVTVGGFSPELLSDDIAYVRQAAALSKIKDKFGMISTKVYVSDRRWQKYGFWNTLKTYLTMSKHFMKNDFLTPKRYKYEFGAYEKK